MIKNNNISITLYELNFIDNSYIKPTKTFKEKILTYFKFDKHITKRTHRTRSAEK